ncbi:MAG: 16S rRNA (uracil(1498)-N(3))-methyltransferase [Bacteroidota bacterium]|nr:16S rRNA (uracil(1498)-N(3))-methyltransferase [Bacteroidota bacterium]
MQLFYTPDISGNTYTLPKEESKHCTKVLRKQIDNILDLTDGKGYFYKAKIIDISPKATVVEVIEKLPEKHKRNFNLHIAIAPTKNINRTEWFLEKATEIGINTITPLLTYHSERKEVKHDRLLRVITSAMKQSLKATHPVLEEMVRFEKFIEKPFAGRKYIAYIDEKYNDLLGANYLPSENALILIGPEGDFSSEEVEKAIALGFEPVSLGNCRLRTETAAIAACHTINLINDIHNA